MISTGGNNLFVTGATSQALVIPTSDSFRFSVPNDASDTVRRGALLVELLDIDRDIGLTQAAQTIMTSALASRATLIRSSRPPMPRSKRASPVFPATFHGSCW